jgi:urease accessory protein
MWLASPALPVGGFSYSEGLEAAVDAQQVADETQAGAWLADQLHLGLARCDLALVASAFPAWQDHDAGRIAALNQWSTTTRETAELRLQSEQMGRSLAEWLKNSAEGSDARIARLAELKPAPAWPLAFALAAVLAGATRGEALLAYAMNWAEGMVQAAIKAVPLGQRAGQRVLRALLDDIPAAVEQAALVADTERQAFMPMLAILSSRHESQYSRLFRS